MLVKNEIQKIIIKALSDVNEEKAPNERFQVDLETKLFGENAALDSLSLVSVIVDVEAAISEMLGQDISLTDDRAMSQKISPFADVNSLTSYIEILVSEL